MLGFFSFRNNKCSEPPLYSRHMKKSNSLYMKQQQISRFPNLLPPEVDLLQSHYQFPPLLVHLLSSLSPSSSYSRRFSSPIFCIFPPSSSSVEFFRRNCTTMMELFTHSTHTHTHTHRAHNTDIWYSISAQNEGQCELSVDTAQSGLSCQADSCPNSWAVDRGEIYWTPDNSSNITILEQKKHGNTINFLKFSEVEKAYLKQTLKETNIKEKNNKKA